MAQKGCVDRWDVVIGWIGVVSHHLQSPLGAIELTVLCAFVCNVGYLIAQIMIRIAQIQVKFRLTYLFGTMQLIIYMEQNYETTCIPHHFLYSISKKHCTTFKPLFVAESTYFHCSLYFDLRFGKPLGIQNILDDWLTWWPPR